jgi:hypothetical protein
MHTESVTYSKHGGTAHRQCSGEPGGHVVKGAGVIPGTPDTCADVTLH